MDKFEIPFESRLKARDACDEKIFAHQFWRELLFLHWKCDPEEIQKTLPPGLYVDTFQGEAYISLIPFFMEEVKLRFLPTIPGLTNFIEINLRTYVYDKKGTPGVWFYSLDLNSWLAARFAKKTYSLPYFFSKLESTKTEDEITIKGSCQDEPKIPIKIAYRRSKENGSTAELESLDFFLIERYILFAYGSDCLYKARVHHSPYSLCKGAITELNHELLAVNSFDQFKTPADLVHYSKEVSVDIFNIGRI